MFTLPTTQSSKKYLKLHWPELSLGLLILAYIIYFSAYTFLRHYHFISAYYDLAIMDQVIWNTAHGHFFKLTAPNGLATVSRFAIHADIFMVLLAPLYWVYDSVYTLLLAQVVIVALGALPVYWLGRDVLKNKTLALIIAAGYLLFGPLQRAVIFDFHAVTLASSFFLFAFYYAYKKRYWPYFIFLILAVSTKETMTFIALAIGLYIIFFQKQWKVGLTTIVASGLWFYLLLWHIMPDARPDGSAHFALDYYSKYGTTQTQIVKTILLKPWVWLPDILNKTGLLYLLAFVVPTGFLSLLSPYLLLALPDFLINLLSKDPLLHQIGFQYVAAISAFAFIAFVFGVRNLRRILLKLSDKYPALNERNIQSFLIVYLLFFLIVSTYALSPLPGMFQADTGGFWAHPIDANYVKQLSQEIPAQAQVTATNKLAPHFSHREHIYYFPQGLDRADYVVAQTGVGSFMKFTVPGREETVADLAKDKRFKLVHKDKTLVVYKRIN